MENKKLQPIIMGEMLKKHVACYYGTLDYLEKVKKDEKYQSELKRLTPYRVLTFILFFTLGPLIGYYLFINSKGNDVLMPRIISIVFGIYIPSMHYLFWEQFGPTKPQDEFKYYSDIAISRSDYENFENLGIRDITGSLVNLIEVYNRSIDMLNVDLGDIPIFSGIKSEIQRMQQPLRELSEPLIEIVTSYELLANNSLPRDQTIEYLKRRIEPAQKQLGDFEQSQLLPRRI